MKNLLSGRDVQPLTPWAVLVLLVMIVGGGGVSSSSIALAANEAREGGTIAFEIKRKHSMRVPRATSMRWSYRTEDGTARAGSDYKSKSGVVTFPWAGGTRTIRVKTLKDCNVEPDQFFTLKFYDLELRIPTSIHRQHWEWHTPAKTYGIPRTMTLRGKIIDITPTDITVGNASGNRCRQGG